MNYELNIGARRFKCTTIPIVRNGYRVVGAICINIDINTVRDEVLKSAENTAAFGALLPDGRQVITAWRRPASGMSATRLTAGRAAE